VFWAGGKIAEEAAGRFALETGGKTIGMTARGVELNSLTRGMDYLTQAKPLWSQASKEFASGASGTVHVFQNARGVGLESIWREVEYPILKNNPNVQIIYHVVGY
jgi:hypothetical protein